MHKGSHVLQVENEYGSYGTDVYKRQPLLAKEGHTQWNPDLIYFNNTEVKPTVGYYAQQMYGQNGRAISAANFSG